MRPFKTLSRTTILNHSKYLTVEDHTIELPDGRVITHWAWIISNDYVDVVAITHEGKFLCFRQAKYGVEGTSLAIIGGYIEPGEDPLIAAQRELLEETGYRASDWTSLGHYRIDANRGVGTAYFFLARQAEKAGEPNSDDLEEQQLLQLSREEMRAGLDAGEFKVLAWTTAVALALLETDQQK